MENAKHILKIEEKNYPMINIIYMFSKILV